MKLAEKNVEPTDKLCLQQAPGYKRLKVIVEKLGIEYVDLLPDFRLAMQDEGINLFRYSDRHWNEQGHQLAAELILTSLKERGYISRPEH